MHIQSSLVGTQVKYASLPNFEDKEEEFRAESVLLRRRFTEEGKLLFLTSVCLPVQLVESK